MEYASHGWGMGFQGQVYCDTITINIEIICPENKAKSIAKFIFNRPKDSS